MAYGDFKYLPRRTAADKVLRNKAFNIAKNPKYDGYQRGLASMVYEFFDKKSASSCIKFMPQNAQLAEELQKPIIRKFKKRKVYSTFLLCVIDIFSKYVWVVSLKDKGISIVNEFQSILKKSSRKLNKI